MVRHISILLVSAVVLTSCGSIRDSRLNPFNWFGRSASQPVATEETDINPLIPRRRAISIFRREKEEVYNGRLIGEISELLIERRPGGAIIRATGVSDHQGPFDVRLVPVAEESNETTLTYEFLVLQAGPVGGTKYSRTVVTAKALSDQQLAGIRTIRVKGRTNVRSSRR